MTCVVMGDFSKSRDDIRQEIEREGGVCIDTPNKQHVVKKKVTVIFLFLDHTCRFGSVWENSVWRKNWKRFSKI